MSRIDDSEFDRENDWLVTASLILAALVVGALFASAWWSRPQTELVKPCVGESVNFTVTGATLQLTTPDSWAEQTPKESLNRVGCELKGADITCELKTKCA